MTKALFWLSAALVGYIVRAVQEHVRAHDQRLSVSFVCAILLLITIGFWCAGCGPAPTAPTAAAPALAPATNTHIPLFNEPHITDLPPCTGSRCIE